MRAPLLVSMKTQYENLGDQTIGALLATGWARHGTALCLTDGVPASYLKGFEGLVSRLGGGDVRYVRGRSIALALAARLFSGRSVTIALSPGDTRVDRSVRFASVLKAGFHLPNGPLRLFQVGASYANVGPNTARLLATGHARGDALSVRDLASQTRIAAEGGIHLPIIPDLAFALPTHKARSATRAIFQFRAIDGVDEAALARRLNPIVEKCRVAGLRPGVFWQVARDGPLSIALSERLGIDCWWHVGGRPEFYEADAIYRDTAVVFSNRLHGLLLGGAAGAIPVAVLDATETKVAGVFMQAGLDDLISRSSDMDFAIAERLIANMSTLKEQLHEVFAEQAAKIESFFKAAACA